MWLAERDACSEVRATIRMSRSSLYTAARRRPEGIPPRREVIGCAVRRRGGAPGRPLHRSERSGLRPDPRVPDRAPNRMCVRRVCAVRASAGRPRSKSRYPGQPAGCRVSRTPRGRVAVAPASRRRRVRTVRSGAHRVGWRGGTAAYRLSLSGYIGFFSHSATLRRAANRSLFSAVPRPAPPVTRHPRVPQMCG